MKSEKEIEDKINELEDKIAFVFNEGDMMAMNCLVQQQLALKWVLKK
jgi:hypothetical protein